MTDEKRIKVFIAAGGDGSRIKKVTMEVIPKSLANINGFPLVSYQLRTLLDFGFQDITISFNYSWQAELFDLLMLKGYVPKNNYIKTFHPFGTEHYMDILKFGDGKKILDGKSSLFYTSGDVIYKKSWLRSFVKLFKENHCSIFTKWKPKKLIPPRVITLNNKIVRINREQNATWSPGPTLIIHADHIIDFRNTFSRPSKRTAVFMETSLKNDYDVFVIDIQRAEYLNINTYKDIKDMNFF